MSTRCRRNPGSIRTGDGEISGKISEARTTEVAFLITATTGFRTAGEASTTTGADFRMTGEGSGEDYNAEGVIEGGPWVVGFAV
jgi:hypothetical protein